LDDVEQRLFDDMETASFITLARIYDLLAVIARAVSPEEAKAILDAHEQGILIGSPPALDMREE
jgi:hypothetical protein